MSWEYWVPDREPVPDWAEIVAAKDAEIERLKAALHESKETSLQLLGQVGQLSEEIARLRAALTEIRDAGPMTIDDQRWRVAKDALEAKQ